MSLGKEQSSNSTVEYNKRQEDNITFIIKHFKFMVSIVGMIVAAAGFYFKIEAMMIQQTLIIKDIRAIKTALVKKGILDDFGYTSIQPYNKDFTIPGGRRKEKESDVYLLCKNLIAFKEEER